MSLTVAVLNLVLGAVYTSYGLMTVVDMRRGWATRGFSHFGAAWIFMAFTCGPHHLVHGAHILFEGRSGGPLDLVAVAIGFPAGVVWFLLRVEAMFLGGRGDREVTGTPAWLEVLPLVGGAYLVWLTAATVGVLGRGLSSSMAVAPNMMLIVLYGAIGAVLLKTQLANRPVTGGWSLSGLALTVVFPTCGLMHAVYAVYASSGRYHADGHGLFIDALSVPAAMYFLWVVWAVARDTLVDWNAKEDVSMHPDVGIDAPVKVLVP